VPEQRVTSTVPADTALSSTQQAVGPSDNPGPVSHRIPLEVVRPGMSQHEEAGASPSKRAKQDTFASKENFLDYLRQNVKSSDSMKMLDEGLYSRKARIDITHVAVAKLVDVYGMNPNTSVKGKIAEWMGSLTNLEAAVYFDVHSHKGYLNKALENFRCKLQMGDKGQKSHKIEKSNREQRHQAKRPEIPVVGEADQEADLLARHGCPRNVPNCDCCEGIYSHFSNLASGITSCSRAVLKV
jgi:hypothetical protein